MRLSALNIIFSRTSAELAMTNEQIVKMDEGAVNDRILAKEVKADFRRVEAASVKMMTHLTSAEAKRMFVRFFNTVQLNAHFVSVIARTKLKHEDVERVEAALRERVEAVSYDLNKAIDGAEALFKMNGITTVATYDTKPLELEVGIISSTGRRYFELLNKLDQLMPLLQTLEIHEVITPRDADIQRAAFKRAIRTVAGSARSLAAGLRRHMNELRAREAERDRVKAANRSAKIDSRPAAPEPADGAGGEMQLAIVAHEHTVDVVGAQTETG
jgi:hypothetical protein